MIKHEPALKALDRMLAIAAYNLDCPKAYLGYHDDLRDHVASLTQSRRLLATDQHSAAPSRAEDPAGSVDSDVVRGLE